MVSSASVEIFRWPASSVINWWICSSTNQYPNIQRRLWRKRTQYCFCGRPLQYLFLSLIRAIWFFQQTHISSLPPLLKAFCINDTNYTVWLCRQMRPIYSINKYFLPTFSFLLSNPVIIVIIFDDSSFLSLTFVSRGAAVTYLFQVWRWWSCPEYRVSSSFTVSRSAF